LIEIISQARRHTDSVRAGKAPDRGAHDTPAYFMVGITNSAPSFVPVGQREVIVFVFV
jgi:hypothetical protein